MRLFYLMITAVCFFACKTTKEQATVPAAPVQTVANDSEQKPQFEKKILGTWHWWKTDCCFRNPHTTYANEVSFDKTLKFEKGTVKTFHNDTLKRSAPYEVSYGLMQGDDNPVVKIDNRPGLLYIKGDTLTIDFGYMDLQTDYYLRKK